MLTYRKLHGYKYELLTDVQLKTKLIGLFIIDNDYISLDMSGLLCIKAHYAWDGPSGPTFDTKTFMRGSLVHDTLYQMMREGILDRIYRKYADQLLKSICLKDGMSKFRAWYVYRAVRIFSKKSSLPRKNPRGQIIFIL